MATMTSELMEKAHNATHGYVASFFDQWSGGPRGKSLRLSTQDSGERIGQVLGWLTTMHAYEPQQAEKLLGFFVERLDYLANYGGELEPGVPRYIVQLSDDGTFAGFGIRWLLFSRFCKAGETMAPGEEHGLTEWSRHGRALYMPAMVGGLVYHGTPGSRGGAAPTFSVRLDSDENPWGIHT